MANLEVKNLAKSYDGKTKVLQDISFTIENGELVSILGPSGCGKTTTLRIIAGLIQETAGQILVNGKDITKTPVYKRNFGMVFQSYALFPHLNVFDNVAFGLKMHKLPKQEINEKVSGILEMTGLSDLASQFPAQLSGGQQQRVSLARALVTNPEMLLMDEPLSNLDAKLRLKMREEIRKLQQEMKMTVLFVTHDQQECFAISDKVLIMNQGRIEQFDRLRLKMREEIRKLQQEMKMTVLFVTHDQQECFAISDKVLIMNQGRIEQFDRPENIFHHPRTEYVARFIGYDNFIPVNADNREDSYHIAVKGTRLTTEENNENAKVLTIRPENIQLNADSTENTLTGTITGREYLGQSFKYTIHSELGDFQVEEARQKMRSSGDEVKLTLPAKHLHPLSE
ncbi:ABC transporter ATP-binding protein [Lactobacillus apis]|uniref:ABC transporter ATP-binding protein n=1 Tax=Lactobacillus apis TaxID=303541 RepID=UPI000C322CD9|nr:ABC transporter ATP-binding protein [Lactobacillus apis]